MQPILWNQTLTCPCLVTWKPAILHKYQHPIPKFPQNAPYQATRPQYEKIQCTDAPMKHHACHLMKPNKFKVLLGLSYDIHKQTPHHESGMNRDCIRTSQANWKDKSWCQPTPGLCSHSTWCCNPSSLPVTCNSIFTAMPVTSMSQVHEADSEDTSILETN